MKRPSILIIEDDEDIQRLLTYQLVRAGFSVSCADSGEDGLEKLKREPFDLVILDIMLPGLDGIGVCKKIRQEEKLSSIPVLMLTAKAEEEDIVLGLDSGADDYVTKPFSPKVLLARIQVLLRRRTPRDGEADTAAATTIEPGCGLCLDPASFTATLEGKALNLTVTEFKILELLSRRPGRVFSRQQIIDEVMGQGYAVTSRAVDVQIHGLRKKLGRAGALIETVRGVGYRLKETRHQP